MPIGRAAGKHRDGECGKKNGQAMTPEKDRTIEAADGTPLHVHILRCPAPKGSVIVVHGLDDHTERYGALSRFLHDSGYDVVLYDQRGHGRSGGARTHVANFLEYVDDLGRVREHVLVPGTATPHLFGHSMGAVIALLAAMRNPERWRSVIVQGFPALPGRTIPKVVGPLVRGLGPLVARLRAPTGLQPADLSHDNAVAEAYRRDPLVRGSVTLGWAAAFLQAIQELREGAAAITCPLLILHGESDAIALPEGSRWLARHAGAQDRRLATFPGLKHELHNELPADRTRVFAEIRGWLDAH
jgi:alpha-beta hydrolase superfamily lysophospholipase